MSTRPLRPTFARSIAQGAAVLTMAGLTLASPIQDARGRGEGGEGRAAGPQDFVERLMQNDQNGDGKLSRGEVPERLAERLFAADANGDDLLDREELAAFMETKGFGRGRGPGAGPEGRGGAPGEAATFEQAMEGLNRAVRRLNRSEFNADTREGDLANVGAAEAALVAAKSRLSNVPMAPQAQEKFGDDERAYHDAMRTRLIEALGTALKLEIAIAAGDADGARKSLAALGDVEDSAHEVFRPRRERPRGGN